MKKFILHLLNFRCFKDQIFDLSFNDNENFILICGKSGGGKSTILYAIYFVLYGTLRKPYTFGEDKCSIELEYDNIKVIRQKKPNRLIVITEDKKYLDLEAQGFIDVYFNEKDYFLQSSFIEQKNLNSFLYQPPIKQLESLEKLCYNDIHPKDILIKIKEELKQIDKDLIIKNTSKDIMKKEIVRKKRTKIVKPIPSIRKFYKDYEDLKIQLDKLNKEYYSLLSVLDREKILEKIKSKLVSLENHKLVYEKEYIDIKIKFEEYKDVENNYSQELNNKKEKIKKLEKLIKYNNLLKEYFLLKDKEKKDYEDLLSSITNVDVDNVNKQLHDKIILRQKYEEMINLDNKIKKQMKDRSVKDKTPFNKKKEIEKLESEEKYFNERLKELYTRECPVCKTKLLLIDNILEISYSKIEIDNKKKLDIEKELEKILSLKNKLFGDLNIIENIIYPLYLEYENIKNYLKEINIKLLIKEIENLEDLLYNNKLEKDLYISTKNKLENNIYSPFVINLENKIKLLCKKLNIDKDFKFKDIDDNELSVLKLDIKNIDANIITIKKLESEYINAKNKLSDLNINIENTKENINNLNENEIINAKSNIKILKENIKNLEEKIQEFKSLKEKIDKWKDYKKNKLDYLNLIKEFKQFKEEEKILLTRVKNLNIIKKHCITAQNLSLTNTLNIINDKTNYFLSFLFKDIPINVRLEFKKDKIFVYVIYNGIDYEDLSSFSGGEKDRLNLAFTLSLNFLLDSKIIMLDECLSSLDSFTFEDIITGLKNVIDNKIVLIISHHYVNESLFDRVLNF